MLFSFVKRRYWWPRHNYVLSKKVLSNLLKKGRGLKSMYYFRSKTSVISILKMAPFLGLYSQHWLYSNLRKHAQRRPFSFRFFRAKLRSLRENKKKIIKLSKIWVRFSTNNIFFNITDSRNKLLTYFSSGLIGFYGPTKTSTFALDQIVDRVVSFLRKKNFRSIKLIFLSGMFNYRSKSVIESVIKKGVFVRAVTYRINAPHNGLRCRKAKRR